jgi:hypothetical protein
VFKPKYDFLSGPVDLILRMPQELGRLSRLSRRRGAE